MSDHATSSGRRLTPDSVRTWAIALREPLRLAVVLSAVIFAMWLLVSQANPVGLVPLLPWALRRGTGW